MCRKYPGKRCGNPIHERVESLTSQIEEAKAFRDTLNPDVVKGPEITKASRRVTILEARLKDAQQKYDISSAGFSALEAAVEDESLSDAERTALKVRLKDAVKQRAERVKVVSDAENRRGNVLAYLEAAGVPADERADFSDANIYLPASGSAKHYETIKNNRMKAYEQAVADLNKGLAKAKTPDEIAKVHAKEGLAVETARSAYNHALYVYDSTSAGVAALKQKVAKAAVCYTAEDVVRRAKLEIRLGNAERAHRVNLDSRNYRTAKLAHLRAVASSYGGDVEGAVKAFKNKNPLPATPRRRTQSEQSRVKKAYTHLTEQDAAIIDSEFRNSDEHKTYGELGMSRFMERKAMVPPHEYYLRESVDEADARVLIGSNGRSGRNNTVIHGDGTALRRNRSVAIAISGPVLGVLRKRAAFMNMSVSSYIRIMALGENVAARANDRSAVHRARKHAKMSQMFMEGTKVA